MDESMTLRITEAELVRDVRAVLDKIERGNEVIIEREDHRPLAVMKQPQPVGRKISECIALAKAYEEKLGYAPIPDEDFAKDVQEGIDAHREPIRNVWDE
jgi:hypothetical protein